MAELSGKVALVTGAAMGIGRAAAEALAGAGAGVALVDREDATPLESGTSVPVRADVSSADQVDAAVRRCVDELGRLDVVVNAAGIQRYGSVADTPEDVWDEVLDVNLKSAYLTGRYAVPHLEEAGGGAIVHVASVQGLASQKGVAAYSASKGGLLALTRAMAVDHAPGIRVNAVCPGSVDTPMLRDAAALFSDEPDETIREWGGLHPLGRVAAPAEIAQAVLFLASPRASFVTGAALLVDGGLLSRIGGT